MIYLIVNHARVLFGQQELALLAEIVRALMGFRKAMFAAESCLTFPAFEVSKHQLLLTTGGSAALLGFRWFCCCFAE